MPLNPTNINTYTIYNNGAVTATINSIVFETPGQIQQYIDLSPFGGPWTGSTEFSDDTTVESTTKTYVSGSPFYSGYVSHNAPFDRTYVGFYITGTNRYLIINSTAGISENWDVDGNGFNRTVDSVTSSTWLELSGGPTGSPTVGDPITFSPPYLSLFVESTTGLGNGWEISGNGYSANQTILNVISSTELSVSAIPNTPPSVGQDITFTDDEDYTIISGVSGLQEGWSMSGNGFNGQTITDIQPPNKIFTNSNPNTPPTEGGSISFSSTANIVVLPPGANVTFPMEYRSVAYTNGASYTATVIINSTILAPVVKRITNLIAMGVTPSNVELITEYSPWAFGDGGGGGDSGPGAPGCAPGDSSPGCSAAGAASGDGGASGGAAGGCFLTTAAVNAMGLPDNCEELTLARFLRDHKMTSSKDEHVKRFYKMFGPVITERNKEWKSFYNNTVLPLTGLIKEEHHDKAVKLYKIATIKLIDKYASRYSDDRLNITEVFDTIMLPKLSWLPYSTKYAVFKAFLKYIIIKNNVKDRLKDVRSR